MSQKKPEYKRRSLEINLLIYAERTVEETSRVRPLVVRPPPPPVAKKRSVSVDTACRRQVSPASALKQRSRSQAGVYEQFLWSEPSSDVMYSGRYNDRCSTNVDEPSVQQTAASKCSNTEHSGCRSTTATGSHDVSDALSSRRGRQTSSRSAVHSVAPAASLRTTAAAAAAAAAGFSNDDVTNAPRNDRRAVACADCEVKMNFVCILK